MRRGSGIRGGILMLIGATVIAACGGGAASSGAKSPYPVYYSAELSDTQASIGQPMLSAIKAQVDWADKHGGIHGHKIVLTALDDAMDPGRVKINVQQAVGANAVAMLGANSSNGWSPNAAFIQQSKIPTIGLGFTDPQLDTAPAYLYGLSPSYAQFVQLQVALAKNVLIKKGTIPAKPRVALYHYSSAAVSTMITYQHKAIDQNGWTFTTEQTFTLGATDVSAQASAIAQGKPDVVFAELIDVNAPLAVKTLRQKGYTGPIVNFSAGSAPATFAVLKDPNYYGQVHFLSPFWKDQPGVAEVDKRVTAVHDTAQMDIGQWPFGWAIGGALIAGLDKCADPCTATKLNSALNNVGKVDINGLNPDAGFSPKNHRLAGAGIYYHWDEAKNHEEPVGTWTRVS